MITRTESRSRIGITWYDSEAEAEAAGAAAEASPGAEAASIGFVQVGRNPGFDLPGEYAVVTP